MTDGARYPGYRVLDKRDSPSWDEITRQVVERRISPVPPRRYLNAEQWQLLDALAGILLPQPERAAPIPITPLIDAMLYEGRSEGYRHAGMPDDRAAWQSGLAGVQAEAHARHGRSFAALDKHAQTALLQALAEGRATPSLWQVPAQRFFFDILLKTMVGIYYAHPVAWDEIGFGGPASPRGYVRLGFDEADAWEAKEAR